MRTAVTNLKLKSFNLQVDKINWIVSRANKVYRHKWHFYHKWKFKKTVWPTKSIVINSYVDRQLIILTIEDSGFYSCSSFKQLWLLSASINIFVDLITFIIKLLTRTLRWFVTTQTAHYSFNYSLYKTWPIETNEWFCNLQTLYINKEFCCFRLFLSVTNRECLKTN